MKRRTAGFLLTLAAAGGCMSSEGDFLGAGMQPRGGMQMNRDYAPVGPWGVPMTTPSMTSSMSSPMSNPAAIMQAGYISDGSGSVLQMSGGCAGGACSLPGAPPMPGGMGGDFGGYAPAGRVNASGYMNPGAPDAAMTATRTQVRFVGPTGAKVGWYIAGPDGNPVLSPAQLDVPGRYNFAQAAIYRLKVSAIPGRPGRELFPSIEVVPSNVKTDAFLSHNVVPVEFTDEDFDQIATGHYITKVIYLPDAQYQSLTGGAEEISSTRLEPGVDPVCEAMRRGHILLVVRVGDINLEVPNSPPLTAPGQFGAPHGAPPPAPMGGHGSAMPVPGPSGLAPASYSMPMQTMPGQMGNTQAPRVSFPQTILPAPRNTGFDMDSAWEQPSRQREGWLDNVIWRK